MSDIEDVLCYGVGRWVEKTVNIDANGVEHIKQVLHVQFDKCTTVFCHVQRGLMSVRRAPKSARIHARRVKAEKRRKELPYCGSNAIHSVFNTGLEFRRVSGGKLPTEQEHE